MPAPYTIDVHRHRFAAWAAGRAANVKGCRITVEKARSLIESAELDKLLGSPNNLPPPNKIDEDHAGWRQAICDNADKYHKDLPVTHGIAAKLINVYLKAAFVCGGYHEHAHVCALHPPIDSLLLSKMSEKKIGGRKDWGRVPWSTLDSSQYQDLIGGIRQAAAGRALWIIEEYWIGYR
jgi:hypothetical protein